MNEELDPGSKPGSDKQRVHILLVDDQQANLMVLEAVLADLDEVLVSVMSGEQALRQLLDQDFALVLMDVQMPTMSGFETAELIRSHPRSRAVPIIFLTAASDADFPIEKAYALGAVDYLTKPVNPIMLRSKVGVFIDLHRKMNEIAGEIAGDIARQERARRLEEVRTRDERIRLILDNTRDYAFIGTDPDGVVTEWEGGAGNITGWSAAMACGQPGALIFTPEDRAAGQPAEEMRRARATGRAEDKRWHVRKDGTRFFADGVMVPLRDDENRLRGYAKIFRDATAERLAAEQLEKSEVRLDESLRRSRRAERNVRRLAAVTEQSSDFIGMIGSDGRCTYLNPAGRRLVGLSPDADMADYEVGDFFAPGCTDFVEREVLPALRGPGGAWEGELQFRHVGSGALIPVYYKAFAMCDEHGERIGMATITHDITQQKQAENELRRIAADLSEADRRKSEFLATLAHELRNPLAPIRTGLDLMKAARADVQVQERVHAMMDRQLGHLIHLVNDLLDVARITRGKIELKKERTDVATVVGMALETSRIAIDSGGHQVEVDVEAAVPLEVDVTRIVQVLSNLLHNAAKYTPPGGHIRITARRDADCAVVSVSDSGVGIPAESLGTLFDMFTQVGRNLERAQGGLGIGLSLVRRLVELHGGSVDAASPGRDQGSTFTVRLPIGAPPLAVRDQSAVTQARVPQAASAVLRILVVDDNVDAAESLAALLELRGHSTRVALDGKQGYQMAVAFRPQLAFIDIGMPGMNGHEVARAIRATAGMDGVLLVALTGWGTRADVAQSAQAGFDLHLTKPVDFGALDAVFEAAMKGSAR